jgi:hypothetical protein
MKSLNFFEFFWILIFFHFFYFLKFFEILKILKFWNFLKILNFKTKLFFFNFRILKIGKPRPEQVLIFPDLQTSGSAGVNFRH